MRVVAVCSLIQRHVVVSPTLQDIHQTTSCNLGISTRALSLCGSHCYVSVANDS